MNVKDINQSNVSDWLFDNGIGPDEAIECADDIVKDIIGHKSSPTGELIVRRILNKIYKDATGLRI